MGAGPVFPSYAYNDAGLLEEIDYSDTTPDVTYSYNRLGQQVSITDASGTKTLTYDPAHLALIGESITGGFLDESELTYVYDAQHRRTSVEIELAYLTRTTSHINEYTYDEHSRFVTVGDGVRNVAYTYLPQSSLVAQVQYKLNSTQTAAQQRHYDGLNRLTSTRYTNSSGAVLSGHHYQYNDLNQRTQAQRADGSWWKYGYNSNGEVIRAEKQLPGPIWLEGQQFAYTYDASGNRLTASFGGDSTGVNLKSASYSVNALNQYSQRTVPGAVDITGKAPASATVTVNAAAASRQGPFFHKEVTLNNSASAVYETITVESNPTVGSPETKSGKVFLPKTPEAFTYDVDGNLTSDGRWTYLWDGENRLIQMEALLTLPAAAKKKLEFVYDSQSRRIGKTVYVWNAVSSSYELSLTHRYFYDGWNLMAEMTEPSAGTAMVRKYLWGPDMTGTLSGAGGVGGLLASFDDDGSATSNSWWYTYDGNGNVSAVVNSDDGILNESYDYSPFGELLGAKGTGVSANQFAFSTKYQDEETGLYYYGYRYYNPSAGRWLNRDPIGERGGFNLYAMVLNDPINWIDLLGLDRLVFDGKQICRMSDSLKECKKCWDAVSGKDLDGNGMFDDFSVDDQKQTDMGPIPEGEYELPSNKTTDPSKKGNWDTDDWNKYEKNDGDGWKPWKTNVIPRVKSSWGDRFARLEPKPGTNTFGRSNFNIHGGNEPGSAGCIDIGCNDKDFYDDIRKDFGGGSVRVTVDYSGNSTKSCDKCNDRKGNPWP